jgi:asparagine synthase (glutamine-hydrolysing)
MKNFFYLIGLMRRSQNLNEIHANWRNKFRNSRLPVKQDVKSHMKGFLNTPDKGFDYAGYYDALAYLPDDILVKVDRAAMAVSLESRAPFLDHRVIEFLMSLPKEFKYKKGTSKLIWKDILYEMVPKSIVDRPKQGFSIPLTFWLRNELKEWGSIIIQQIPEDSEFWDKEQICKLWDEHQKSKLDHTERLWNILVLESFFKRKGVLHYSLN